MYIKTRLSIGFFAALCIGTLCAISGFTINDKIKYLESATVPLDYHGTASYRIAFSDSILNDTLYQMNSKEGYPVAYYRKIQTDICFDQKCRMLDIVLYWNITGRYLGFELPKGEFLSKTDHEPFVASEYRRLHEILADERSPLAGFTFNQLVMKPAFNVQVDGVTSATLPSISNHIVTGAAYTTYKLWHIVYGRTKQEVERLTAKSLSAELALNILQSPSEEDKIWALNHLNGRVKLSPELIAVIVRYIDSGNYSHAERAIAAINPSELESDSLQVLLLERLYLTDHSVKRLLIDKLNSAPHLSEKVERSAGDNIGRFNADILTKVLGMLKKHGISDVKTYEKISSLLTHDNQFISRKAYDFLKGEKISDGKIQLALDKYVAGRQR